MLAIAAVQVLVYVHTAVASGRSTSGGRKSLEIICLNN
jgi:hypothetical protein